MTTFLHDAAQFLISESPGGFKKSLVILPGKRAELYLRQELISILETPSWLPKMMTLGEFKTAIVGLAPLSALDCTLKLYQEYVKVCTTSVDTFERFLKWGPTVLSDFNAIENYLLDGQRVYGDLKNITGIEDWSFQLEELSTQQKKFSNFWSEISVLYQSYRSSALDQGWYYAGLHSRIASEILSKKRRIDGYDKICFVGLNALTPSEQAIVYQLQKDGVASTFWDIDQQLLNDPLHEAGHFMREHQKQGGKLNGVSKYFESKCLKIQAIACSTEIGEAKTVAHLLSELSGSLDKTAIVLANEKLLVPLLHSLPEKIKQSNITLGYPLHHGRLFQLIELINNIVVDRLTSKHGIHHQQLLSFLRHSYVLQVVGIDGQAKIATWIRTIKTKNLVRINPKTLEEIAGLEGLRNLLIEIGKENVSFIQGLRTMMDVLSPIATNEQWEREQLYLCGSLIDQLQRSFDLFGIEASDAAFYNLLTKESKNLTVSFFGEPLHGLQIIGMLETRALDFERVIFLGANEGQFPPSRGVNTLIPNALRRHFGLPVTKDQHSLYAYYVYRLLQRSNHVDFVYSQAESTIGNNELSHLVPQITNDLPEVDFCVTTMDIGIPKSNRTPILSNSSALQKRTEGLLQRGISASAINTFLRCPLDFYYKYLIGLKEPEEVEDQISQSSFGIIVHDVLEQAYKPIKGELMTAEFINDIQLDLEKRVQESVKKLFHDRRMDSGINLLIQNSAIIAISKFLQWEANQLRQFSEDGKHLRIVDLETNLSCNLKVNGYNVKINGVIDRVDMCGNELRIIDYKTGGVKVTDLEVDELFSKLISGSQPKALQLLTYGYLWDVNHKPLSNPTVGIISVKKLSNDLIPLSQNKVPFDWTNIEATFSNIMGHIIGQMFNSELDVTHNVKSSYCSYC